MTKFAGTQRVVRLVIMGSAVMLTAGILLAQAKFDGNWNTELSCEAHGETPAYKWQFPATIMDGKFHAQHGEKGGPGYLVIDGKINDDGSAKLAAKGTVENSNAHGVFAIKGNNYGYDIKAQFNANAGTGTRNEGAGILGRPCTFQFTKQDPNAKPADSGAKPDSASPAGGG
jgi:hypothetical protein